MPQYAIYDSSGSILQTVNCDETDVGRQITELFPNCAFLEVERVEAHDRIDIETLTVVKGVPFEAPIIVMPEVSKYVEQRRLTYPSIGAQMDALYKAMASGVLPMVPDFFKPIALVKAQFPKDDSGEPTIIYQAEPV